ncbi:MAG: ATP-dependent helicase [Eubacteriales bacterium]
MENIFDKLNDKQIEAVTATEGYVRIIAGAGSGKTKTLTHRYAYLVEAAGIHPGNILCVTFTNKAAGEMKRRVRSLVGDGYDTSLITTYHGFCVRVLREDIGKLFYPQNFTILDEADQKKILEEIYTELEIKLDRASFENILDKIHEKKVGEDYVSMFVSGEFGVIDGDSSDDNIIRMYMAREKNVFGLDFDDLVSFTFALFKSYPEVLGKWQKRLHYIQVDEFQDSSKRELRLISMLAQEHRNLFVVGDPDQNIYEWRGADMAILVDFDKTFPGCETIMLNRNYRSTPKILKCANTLIAKNKNRIPKDLYTVGDAGDDVIHLHSKSEKEEGKWIAGEIKRLVKNEGVNYRDIAILYRSGFLSRFAEQALSSAGIPYELFGSLKFYDRMEIRDSVAYLKLIAYNDDAAFERIINTPKRMFGKVKMAKLKALAENDGLSYYETLLKYIDLPEFRKSAVLPFVLMMEELRSKYKSLTIAEIISEVLSKSGYERYIRENGSMERLDNLAEFKRSAVEEERSRGEEYTLEEFLSDLSLRAQSDDDEEKRDKVKLMTIHASKGLEFPVCFVCGFTDGIFPSGRTLEERKEAGLEEERRLCFVALTRAMKRLYLTESEGNSAEGSRGTHKKQPSRFIYEIGEENYTRIGVIPKELSGKIEAENSEKREVRSLHVGDEVAHPVFGRGIIEEIDEKRGVYNIKFDKTGDTKPVGMDYDFDKWKNIAALREKALEEARNGSTESKKAIAENEVLEDKIEDNADIPEPESERNETDADAGEESKAEPETKPEQKSDGKKKPRNELENQISMELPPEKPDKSELPEKYRNAEWLREVDEGEENLWKRSDVPHEGWKCVNIIDLGAPLGICRMCGYQIIRYVHVMEHPSYPRKIGAGCVCAGRMEGNPEAARERENAFKNRLSRRETFLSTKMKRSKSGNEYVKYKGEIITLIKDKFKPGFYKTAFRGEFSPSYPTRESALLDAFDKIDPPLM